MTLLDTRPDLNVKPGTVVRVPISYIKHEMICGDHEEDWGCESLCVERGEEEWVKWECIIVQKSSEIDDDFVDTVASTPDIVIGYYTIDGTDFTYRDGHHRLAAAIRLGWEYVNVKCIPDIYYDHDIESA